MDEIDARGILNPGAALRRDLIATILSAGATYALCSPTSVSASPREGANPGQAAELTPRDFDFLIGAWNVHHCRLRKRLVGNHDWDEFGGTLINRPMMGGFGNIGDNVMGLPAGSYRGIGLRVFDAEARVWSSWWLDGRTPAAIAPALRGAFAEGVGTFVGDDVLDGRTVAVRVRWSRITARSARWEQALSTDGGATWETNWTSDFRRMPA